MNKTMCALALAALTACTADDTLTTNPIDTTDGALRVVGITLDGKTLGAEATSRGIYDTSADGVYDNAFETVGSANAHTYNKQHNRIITGFSTGDALDGYYSFDGTNKTNIYLYHNGNGNWELHNKDSENNGIGNSALAVRPNGESEKWENAYLVFSTAKDNIITVIGTEPYYFPVKCIQCSDMVNTSGYCTQEWKNKYGSGGTEGTNYADSQKGRLPSASLVATHPGSYHIGTTDADRGQVTISLVHIRLALLTLADADLTISGWPEGYNDIATMRADQMKESNTDINDNSGDVYPIMTYRPVFSRLRVGTMVNGTMTDEMSGGTPVRRWQSIVQAKGLATGNYGDGTDESYGTSTDKAINDANKTYNLRRLHIRLCKKEDAPDPKDPSKADKSKWSDEFIVTLGGDTGIEMRENHRYRLALSLTPSHLGASIVAQFPTWTGSEEELPNQTAFIYTAQDLVKFATKVNNGNTSLNASLMDDIDLSSVCGDGNNGTTNASWTPIGTDGEHTYSGTFDGNGHTISNLYINTEESNNQGLFGYTIDATIKNIKMENTNVTACYYVGGLIGRMSGGKTSGNTVTTAYLSGWGTVGGIIGTMSDGNTSDNTVESTCIIASDYAGGLQ